MHRSFAPFLVALAILGVAIPASRCVASCHDVVHFDLAGCPDEHGDDEPSDDVEHVQDSAELANPTVAPTVVTPAPPCLELAPPSCRGIDGHASAVVAPEVAPPITVLRL